MELAAGDTCDDDGGMGGGESDYSVMRFASIEFCGSGNLL